MTKLRPALPVPAATADAKSAPMLTQGQQIRLESVCLVYRHDRPPEDAIDRATKIAAYVAGPEGAAQAADDKQGDPEALI